MSSFRIYVAEARVSKGYNEIYIALPSTSIRDKTEYDFQVESPAESMGSIDLKEVDFALLHRSCHIMD